MTLVTILVLVLIFLVAALPLHFAVRLLGGQTTWLKSAGVNLLVGVVSSITGEFFPLFGALVGFILMLFLYRLLFRLRWWKTIVVWLVQSAFIVIFILLAMALGVVTIASILAA